MSESLYYKDITSRFGNIEIIWKETKPIKVQRIILQNRDTHKEPIKPSANTPPEIHGLLDNITRFLNGEAIIFDLNILELDLCSSFQKKVLLAEYNIPRGSVSTYSRIANYIGAPKAARAVGNALAKNPFPLVIPCHRAVRSDSSLGGYQGGAAMKKELLEMEGIKITNNRVQMKKITY